jgi:hypothetical protein
MPKAAVNEDCSFLFGKGKIGFAEKFVISSPTLDVVCFEKIDKF